MGVKRNGYHECKCNYLLLLIYASIKSLLIGVKLCCDLEEATASVMAIGSEVFGSCVGEINSSVEKKNRGVWLCCGWKYTRFILAGKRLNIWGGGGRCCQVLDGVWGCLRVVEEIKKPLWWQGLVRLSYKLVDNKDLTLS